MVFVDKSKIIPLFFALTIGCATAAPVRADAVPQTPAPTAAAQAAGMTGKPVREALSATEKNVLALSQQMWRWMSDRNTEALTTLYNDKVMFVHMSRTLTKSEELDVIKSGNIQYKKVDIQESSVRLVDSTAIVLTKMRLGAVVGGNEVTNPFMVTEVYVRQGKTWTLASLAFTRLLGD
ncbi:nuclear transport factor 2 family protein [Pseudoduganella umbonata]|uniref:Nuclear transport factor 2 family protein n=1 Tax=Pseudoduganella umbonata TaxID=864828 RepID=A0A4P8HHY9_9BURK|nr:nuclear transport factor 2 family protein [Pseudoduganella umbonata]MBB3221650.1 hypothetical protein [Pseudoduganella umbonata]QCP09123.1 nuclear transport factor 2 family protein [Pseudoduganella umbonata]